MKDPGKSIRARLLNIAKKENLSFQLVIIRYMHERLLYRISLSDYSNSFCLKGGALMYIYTLEKTRPTRDIDFLGSDIPYDKSYIESVFRVICSISDPFDAVFFDSGSIISEEITGQDKYPGIRLFITSTIDTIIQRIQVDVGFGDIVIPKPVKISYPTFFPESNAPVILAYSLETVLAEKFEAMIDLSTINSRMKDFYDVYQILVSHQLDPHQLSESVKATFANRKTGYTHEHALFSPSFSSDEGRIRQWKTFLKKNHLDTGLEFERVMEEIVNSLSNIWESLK
jgi:predicted nucleotidyltransferase component of viral defense system